MKNLPTVSPARGPRFVRHTGTAVPLSARTVHRNLFEAVDSVNPGLPSGPAFEPLRYLNEYREHQDFLLRRESYCGATILLADAIVGAESNATEGGLKALDLRVVIAPGFGPVFFSTAVRQGILLVALAQNVVDTMFAWVEAHPREKMTVDLDRQLIDIPSMGRIPFETLPRVRHKLLHGLDDLDELIEHREDAVAFRMEDRKRRPWLYANDAPVEPGLPSEQDE